MHIYIFTEILLVYLTSVWPKYYYSPNIIFILIELYVLLVRVQ